MVITINAIMDYAVLGLLSTTRYRKLVKHSAEKNEPRATLQKERLPEFLSAWNELSLWEPSKLALLFQIITMVRPSEAGGALWNEIDFDNQSGKSLQAG
jgi:integrase